MAQTEAGEPAVCLRSCFAELIILRGATDNPPWVPINTRDFKQWTESDF